MSAQGEPEGPPNFVAPGVGDSGTGLHAGIGMLAALRARDATGDAQRVEIAMQDGIVNLMRIRMIDTFNTGLPVERQGNTAWGGPPMIYPCKPAARTTTSLSFSPETHGTPYSRLPIAPT